eukprot:TRINITY_DN10896_c0_g1_i2.p1 TRINITY_DN10896_c0_g1~~TRINITY_DN10896_c0_g1_i2.p1  ORF type:complete len:112 (+),score=24.32 TRINITY_DN10896_c0_g1_i2:90-425(+)
MPRPSTTQSTSTTSPSTQYKDQEARFDPILFARSNWKPILTWIVCGIFARWIEFGAVFLMISVLVVVTRNLGSKKPGEWSAYAAFNPGGVALAGTYTAEQLEKQIRHQNNM